MTVARTHSVLAVLVAVGVAACSGAPVATSSVAASSVVIDVMPSTASVGHRQSVQLNATVTGTAVSAVTWAADCGSITQTGLFTAPDSDAVCNVVARPEADTAKSASAIVTVSASAPLVSASAPLVGWSAKCAAEPMRTTGTTYYACDCRSGAAAGCKAGSDSNAGTDPRSPVQTMGKAAQLFRSAHAGDTVALCKGGVFNITQTYDYSNFTCGTTSSATCILRDYDPRCAGPSCVNAWGTGAEPKPAVVATTAGVTAMRFNGGASTPGSHGIRVLNIRFTASIDPKSSQSDGIGLDPTWTDMEFCNIDLDNFGTGFATNGKSCATLGSRWYFRGNRVTNSCTMGILVDLSDSDFDGNYFDNNGHDACANYSHILNPSGGTSHTFYWASWCGGKNVRFINNEVHRNSYYNGGSIGSAINVVGGQNFTAENNLVDLKPTASGQYAGAFFGQQAYAPTQLTNLVVRRNRIIAERGRQIGYSSAPNAIIEDNAITISTSDVSQTDGVIMIPHHQGSGPVATSGVTVRNNTIYINATGGSYAAGISVAGDPDSGSGFNVTGNSITYAGMSSGACFVIGATSRVAYMERNHCYNSTKWGAMSGSDYSLANWRTATGFDANSITSAPQFVSAPTDFTPASGSPLIGAASTATNCTVGGVANQSCSSSIGVGTVAWSSTDGAKSRSAPDIGAYEQ